MPIMSQYAARLEIWSKGERVRRVFLRTIDIDVIDRGASPAPISPGDDVAAAIRDLCHDVSIAVDEST